MLIYQNFESAYKYANTVKINGQNCRAACTFDCINDALITLHGHYFIIEIEAPASSYFQAKSHNIESLWYLNHYGIDDNDAKSLISDYAITEILTSEDSELILYSKDNDKYYKFIAIITRTILSYTGEIIADSDSGTLLPEFGRSSCFNTEYKR